MRAEPKYVIILQAQVEEYEVAVIGIGDSDHDLYATRNDQTTVVVSLEQKAPLYRRGTLTEPISGRTVRWHSGLSLNLGLVCPHNDAVVETQNLASPPTFTNS